MELRLPRWLSGKESPCQCRRHVFDPWVGKMPWRRKWHPTPIFLPEEFHEQRSLAGYSLWGHKVLDMTHCLSMHSGVKVYLSFEDVQIDFNYILNLFCWSNIMFSLELTF